MPTMAAFASVDAQTRADLEDLILNVRREYVQAARVIGRRPLAIMLSLPLTVPFAIMSLVLTGGGLGIATLRALREEETRLAVDWSRVELWWGDERCVPPTHEWSNYALAERSLLRRLEIPPHTVVRLDEVRADRRARACFPHRRSA